jgi:hypothetical protein
MTPSPPLARFFVINYTRVATEQIAPGLVRYTYRASIRNDQPKVTNATVKVKSTSPYVQILDDQMVFGTIDYNVPVESQDTFSFQTSRPVADPPRVALFISWDPFPPTPRPLPQLPNTLLDSDIKPQSYWDNLPLNQWIDVPGTQLTGLAPSPLPPGKGFPYLYASWSGAALDRVRERIIVRGGGHQGYAGNEVYVFSVPHLKFARIWGPTHNSEIPTSPFAHEVYLDGNPGARETYWGLAHVEATDRLFMVAGALWKVGYLSNRAWLFDLKQLNWEKALPFVRKDLTGVMAHYDPITRHVFVLGGRTVEEFDPLTKTILSQKTMTDFVSNIVSSVILPEKRKILIMEENKIRVFDLATQTFSYPTVTGETRFFVSPVRDATSNFYYAGMVYVPPLNRILVWDGGGTGSSFGGAIYSIDPDTWVSRKLVVGGLAPKGTNNGMYGRMQYVPSKKVLVFLTDVRDDVRLIKLLP